MTKYIGEVLKEPTRTQSDSKHAVCIGITPWNNVTNRKKLIMERIVKVQDTNLDINHTCFLLVDNNYAENHGNVIDFSAHLITMMRKLQYEGTTFFLYTSVFSYEN